MTAFETIEGCRAVYPAGRRDARLLMRSGFPTTVLTRPSAAMYGWVAKALRRRRLRTRPTAGCSARVISIGNLEVGGNGKTPFAIFVIRTLVSRAYRPVYVSRGFRSRAERLRPVTVRLPSDHGGEVGVPSGVRIVSGSRGLAAEIGDEGAMLALRCPEVPLIFSRDRCRAIDLAVTWLGASHVILDDAFQTWGLQRDLDIVLVDGQHPFGNGRLVPAGTLREEPAALSRSGLVGANGVTTRHALDAFRDTVRSAAGREVPVFGLRRQLLFVDSDGLNAEPPHAPVASLSSIARPAGLDRLLAGAGADVRLSIRYPDHHPYGPADMTRVAKIMTDAGISHVVTTEKDWAKLCDLELPFAITIARLELSVEGPDILPIIEKPQAMPAAF